MLNASKLARRLNAGTDTVTAILGRYPTAVSPDPDRIVFLGWKLQLSRGTNGIWILGNLPQDSVVLSEDAHSVVSKR